MRLLSADPSARILAGGTDLLPNIKHRIFQPRHLIGIGQAMPTGWQVEDGELVGMHIVGAQATDLIHIGQMGLLYGATIDSFVENIFNFPTLAETYRVAALKIVGQRAALSLREVG